MITCEEVKISLHDYVDNAVNKKTKREIEEHFRTCKSCYAEYNKITLFLGRLKDLAEGTEPPNDIVENFSKELLERTLIEKEKEQVFEEKKKKHKKERKQQSKPSQPAGFEKRQSEFSKSFVKDYQTSKFSLITSSINIKKTLKTILPLVLIGIGYLVYQFLQVNTPWQLDINHGYYYINGKEDLTGKLDKGQTLEVQDSSLINVFVPHSGRIDVQSLSSITLIDGNDNKNVVALNSGAIRITTTVLIPKLFVDVEDFSIRDVGGVFSVKYKDSGDVIVFVEFGLVQIFYKGQSYYVNEGYYNELRSDQLPGTPYRFDASDSLKQLINTFDLYGESNLLIGKIIDNVSKSDALTLLALIPRVSAVNRQLLFQKLANFIPPPNTVTRMGIITLNREMLNNWWNEIEWQI